MMLPSAGAPRLSGLDRGSTGLVNRRGLLPGAAPTPPGTAPSPALPASPGYEPFSGTANTMGMAPTDPTLATNRVGGPAPTLMSPGAAPTPAPAPAAMPSVTPFEGTANMAAPPAPSLKGVSVSGIDPANDLRNSTIAPTNDVNRFDLINDRLKNYDATALPQFQSNIRKTVSSNAGMGRLGSGMLNTDLGNETLAAENARNSYFGNLLTDATQGTIADAANNRAELRGERGYQGGQEQQAYDRSRQGVFDTDALTNSAAGRAATQAQLGFANDPSSLIAMLAQMSGQNAAGGAAGVGSSSANQQYIDMLKKILAQGGGAAAATPPAAMGQ